jgi:hypothetical protein
MNTFLGLSVFCMMAPERVLIPWAKLKVKTYFTVLTRKWALARPFDVD